MALSLTNSQKATDQQMDRQTNRQTDSSQTFQT